MYNYMYYSINLHNLRKFKFKDPQITQHLLSVLTSMNKNLGEG